MARLAVNGTNIAYHDEGRGDPPLVFIHGWACDSSFWQLQFDNLKADHRCLSIDLRGRGASDATPPYDVVTAADDVAAIVCDLELQPAIAVGHSLGGVVALVLNWRWPEAVCGVVLGDSPVGSAVRRYDNGLLQQIREAGSMEPARTLIESFFVEDTPHDVREQVRRTMLTCPISVAQGMLSNTQSYRPQMDEIVRLADKKPFMALWAAKPLGDPNRLREITMFLRQEPVAGAGHFFQIERPEVTNALLRAFVDDVRRDPRLRRETGAPA